MTYATPLMQDRGERLPVAISVPERGIMPCCTRVWGSALSCPRSSRTSDGMFAAALNAVSSLVAVLQPGASLLTAYRRLAQRCRRWSRWRSPNPRLPRVGRSRTPRHRATGAGRDVTAGVQPDSGILKIIAISVLDCLAALRACGGRNVSSRFLGRGSVKAVRYRPMTKGSGRALSWRVLGDRASRSGQHVVVDQMRVR